MVRKFLYGFAILIVVVFLGRVVLTFWSGDLAAVALVPSRGFEPQAALPGNAYTARQMWFTRPDMVGANGQDDPAHFRPAGLRAGEAPLDAAVFFIPPTSYLDRSHWNAPLDDVAANKLSVLMIRGMASAFGASPAIWIPKYRQATFGAFLTDKPEGTAALDLAYGDVRSAFAAFLAQVPANRPIVLAGHSQGAMHLKRLMRDEIAGKPVAQRIAAAYVIGWPVSLEHDLPLMGLPACTTAAQPGCVASWLSYAEPADTKLPLAAYRRFAGLDGRMPGTSAFLCTNPLNWTVGGAAPASANEGTLLPDAAMTSATLEVGMVPARCGADNFLLIGPGPPLGQYVLPGNNYHVYDIPLFWANLRANVAERVAAWQAVR
ncbi:MAG: DUF3089 domain-containing protein [Sphingomonadales bacterium]|nr:DUF3089 domain-containing protein [Sphingomonadales bacterium]MBU3993868.1 DUF3089 domain-containing protein [Alphaproteobacteria bacterium]